ncbi:hypothetical protein G7074_13735 [Pedobacter sp. HDW13]|uniref:hypothetical protein n=1 Tax=unclassified Pedobacter TaxID=2628915 RepID=UPI000F5A1E3E|nr:MULTISPECIES: hypothetical protein [unclassified Pedobacter]QIL40228.1 hypothetical protein G7074_13735 [Pedobacter sp. HDW13]RQO79319.1 hypothetical protein DBR40_02860 [Pedobacter sp. KBW01]
MNLFRYLTIVITFLSAPAFGQNSAVVSYPKIAAYVGIMHPIVTFSSAGTDTNFDGHYVVGMPVGINIWKSQKVGFSAEFVPTLRAENGSSKMSNFTFHPGILLALGSGFTFAGRLAFETSGRYGVTPVLNKTVIKSKNCNYFAALPLPLRFGNDKPASFTLGFQFGIAF